MGNQSRVGMTWRRYGKYNAKKVKEDGYVFDSKREYARYGVLKILRNIETIHSLEVHPRFVLAEKTTNKHGEKIRAITYAPDFKYFDTVEKRWIIEDVKGVCTEAYKIKKNLFLRTLEANTIFVEIN